MTVLRAFPETLCYTTSGTGFMVERNSLIACCPIPSSTDQPTKEIEALSCETRSFDDLPLVLVLGQRATMEFGNDNVRFRSEVSTSRASFLRMTSPISENSVFVNTNALQTAQLPRHVRCALSFLDQQTLQQFNLSVFTK